MPFQPKQRVRLVKVDKRLNKALCAHLGEEATVLEVFEDDSCKVRFDRSDVAYGIWTVAASRLASVNGLEVAG